MTANSISWSGAKLIRLANQQVCVLFVSCRKAVILTFPILNEIFNVVVANFPGWIMPAQK